MNAKLPVRRARRAVRAPAPVAVAALSSATTAACDSGTPSGEGADRDVHTLAPEPRESPRGEPSPRSWRSGIQVAPPGRTVDVRANSREAAGVKASPGVAQAVRG